MNASTYSDGYERCPHHPSEIISNGVFDAPCGGCEHEMEHSPEADYADFLQGIAAHFSRICNDGAKGDGPPASWSGPFSTRVSAHKCCVNAADQADADIPF